MAEALLYLKNILPFIIIIVNNSLVNTFFEKNMYY